MIYLTILTAYLTFHFLADYPLQGQFLSDAKAGKFEPAFPRWHAMLAHTFIHAGGVYFITLYFASPLAWLFFAIELGVHWATDRAKVNQQITLNQDQAIHWGCKLLYVVLIGVQYNV